MSNAAHETQKIQADAARIASLRMELIEEMNGLEPITECTCDRDPLGVCQKFPGFKYGHGHTDESYNFVLAECLADLAAQSEAYCLNCKTTENLRDGDECFACYDMRLHDAEMFARHGGDV